MKQKINARLIMIAAISIVLTMLFSVVIFYEQFKNEVNDSLKTYAYTLADIYNSDPELATKEFQFIKNSTNDNIRISVIDNKGIVVYDSDVDAEGLSNHSNRPEISDSYGNGFGYAMRHSETLDKNLFYYAVKANDGSIIRAGKATDSMVSVLMNIVPGMLILAVIVLILCGVISHYLVKKIVSPIDAMADNLDAIGTTPIYKELMPFINTIRTQHEDILKNAQMRQEFTANVSHELKTPLTSISGYSELIENGMATEEDTVRFAGEIHHNSMRLLSLINDIIRLSEMDVTNTDIEDSFENIDIYHLAEVCVNMLQINCEKNNITLTVSGDTALVMGNKGMLEELVYNLCDNAIRYNEPNGTVNVDVHSEDEHVILTVKDTGIGISKEHQDRIFERFYRVDKSRSKKSGGTGLGLAIVKHIVAKHNATIELESEKGKGTTIRVRFPEAK